MSALELAWKTPTDVMRLHRLKKKPSLSKCSQQSPNRERDKEPQSSMQSSQKRRNPFLCESPSKRRPKPSSNKENSPVDVHGSDEEDIICSDSESENSQHKLFLALNTVDQNLHGPFKKTAQSATVCGKLKVGDTLNERLNCPLPQIDAASDGNQVFFDKQQTEADSIEHMVQGQVPIDWSLKLKVRILVPSAAVCMSLPSSVAEARSHMDFVCNAPLESTGAEGFLDALKRVCNYWVHPSLSWFPDFPRIAPDYKSRRQAAVDVGHIEPLLKALHQDWMETLAAVFQQLKAGLCPYFYVCGHLFTALFRSPGIGGYPYMTACVTPTTRGFREALRREGVDFTMPNLTSPDSSTTPGEHHQTSPPAEEMFSSDSCRLSGHQLDEKNDGCVKEPGRDDNQVDITSTDEGASLWLEELGVDRRRFPSLEPSKVKIQREDYRRVDLRAQSLVFCQGVHVQAFFNFLMNCRSCIAVTGPQAGIPPTILSPTPFRGATVHSNKIHHSIAKLSGGCQSQDTHVVDISGPLLPHHLVNITALTPLAVGEPALISHSTHDPTIPFNVNVTMGSEDVTLCQLQSDFNQRWLKTVHSSVRHLLLGSTSLSSGTALQEVRCDLLGFKWSA